MSRTQRLALLAVAAAIALVALVVLPGSNDDQDVSQQAAQTATEPTATSTAETTATETETAPKPRPKPPLLRAGAERQLEFETGDTVRFRVRHPSPEEVHVHGYDISKEIEAGKTATLSFKAKIEGIFEVELERSGTALGTIKVEPR